VALLEIIEEMLKRCGIFIVGIPMISLVQSCKNTA
jgi:hypothetical protein